MIYTVTFNPSLDYIVSVEDFRLGRTNRTSSELLLPGGKGLNVSMVLRNLGIESVALGFAAGFLGEEILRRAGEMPPLPYQKKKAVPWVLLCAILFPFRL